MLLFEERSLKLIEPFPPRYNCKLEKSSKQTRVVRTVLRTEARGRHTSEGGRQRTNYLVFKVILYSCFIEHTIFMYFSHEKFSKILSLQFFTEIYYT